MVIDTEDSASDDEDSMMRPLIYPEDSDNKDSLRNPPSAEPTPVAGPPSGKTTEEPTSEPDYDALSAPFAPTKEDPMGKLYPKEKGKIHPDSPL